jgi:hypothetical protein
MMKATVRNRLLALGSLWGVLLAVVPALVMASRLTGFVVAALLCAALSGCVGTLVAGRRALRKRSDGVLAGLGTGLLQGLVGGVLAAALIWALTALTLSGFTLEFSTLMSPRVFLGSFFVALSVFLYSVAGGLLLGPAFGTLVNRAVKEGGP